MIDHEKRYQVFVSSTYEDLKEARARVMHSLLELGCIPSGMELFSADDDDQWTVIKRVIDESDYYLVIIGGRYGSCDPTGLGYTEKEYDYALSQGKPIIAFIHSAPHQLPSDRCDTDDDGRKKFALFREKVRKRLCKDWTTPAELAGAVTISLVKLINTKPAEGWIRARYKEDPAIARRNAILQEKIEELEAKVTRAATTPPPESDQFAGGSDPVKVHVSIKRVGGQEYLREISSTWDRVFSAIGLFLFNPQTDSDVCNRLKDDLVLELHPQDRAITSGIKNEYQVPVRDFTKIMVQFQALGLVEYGPPLETSGKYQTRWQLTMYGRAYLTRLVAIPRSATPSRFAQPHTPNP